jgi:hypothetical protein
MASQEQTGKKAITLSVKKRRFDGGIEKDLIAYIESQQDDGAMAKANNAFTVSDEAEATYNDLAGPVRSTLTETQTALDPPAAEPPKDAAAETRYQMVQALCRGPVEIVVGLLGLVTSVTATAIFGWLKQDTLKDEAQMLRRLSFKTMLVGARHSLYGPLTVPQILFQS